MRLLHLSDLHLGKKLNSISLLEDQEYILNQILQIIKKANIDGVIIAGDVFDKSLPPVSAVTLFDDFLHELSLLKLPIFIISGNHDSPERLAYGNRLFATNHIYISPTYQGNIEKITLEDNHGPINFYLLPFLKPALVRPYLPTDKDDNPTVSIKTYDEAIAWALQPTLDNLDSEERNILLAHQFVTGALKSDSEDIAVGGIDNVAIDHLLPFDYVALGHLHTPQKVIEETIRYCGTPLKYSLSESKQNKSVAIIDLQAKGDIKITLEPLTPLRDLRRIKGTYEELTYRPNYEHTNTQDFIAITLTDEQEIPDAINRLRVIYPNILQLTYDNVRTKQQQKIEVATEIQRSPEELFAEFYKLQNNQELTSQQNTLLRSLIAKIWEVNA